MNCSTTGFSVLHYLPGPLNQWCHPTISSCCSLLLLPSIYPSIRVFSNESALPIRWPKYWNFSFSISPFNECSWFISFRIDWFDLLAVQGTLKSLLQHHSSKASILQCSAFFRASLVAQLVKNPPAMQETSIWFLGLEDPLEKGTATHFSTLAWRIGAKSRTWLSEFYFQLSLFNSYINTWYWKNHSFN